MLELSKNELIAERSDLSQFLFHLTRDGKFIEYGNFEEKLDLVTHALDARKSLIDILRSTKIEARSAYGFFNYKVPYKGRNLNSKVKREWLRAVCFTETPLDEFWLQFQKLPQRDLQFRPYGLAFKEEVIKRAKGNPVFYINSIDKDLIDAAHAIASSDACLTLRSMLPLFETFGPPIYSNPAKEIDFRWEREWRIPSDFKFDLRNVAFGLCPTDEIPVFEKFVKNKFPFVDPLANPRLAKAKLRRIKGLESIR